MDPRPTLKDVLKQASSPETALIALNAVVYLRDMAPHWRIPVTQDDLKVEHAEIKNRLDYLNR